jgi:hypothetical protein
VLQCELICFLYADAIGTSNGDVLPAEATRVVMLIRINTLL